ncbi:CTTNBP2 N-terminal-like protein [Neolamprologus brichardi]|uniref:CTTNBP2 N-terminal-like protein n=1 Tax=Neolamprologus brichardi TaxID=32507 RepID=UPI0003EBC034|nr:CTTNBP2 N-terminal-like protein [Neolamprologus brichardi]
MLEFSKTSEGLMKSKLNMESLSKPELLMLFSILEGELEARDLVIEALKVIADLEEEKRKHAEDTAEGDDVTYILEKERERLQQQLEFERSQVRRLEKEQRRITDQLEEERAQHKQLSCALAKECKWASARALEEGHRLSELSRKLEKEKETCQSLRKELEDERTKALRMEARVEEQLAEFDTEREQLRSRLKKEEAHCCQLQHQVEELKRKLEEVNTMKETRGAITAPTEPGEKEWATNVPPGKSLVDSVEVEDIEEDGNKPPSHANGHHCPAETNGHHGPQNGNENPPIQTQTSFSPSTAVSPTLPCSSPCASPVLAKRPSTSPNQESFQSPYQAGINQRFHAARHKFQGTPDPEPQSQAVQPALPLSPKDPSPAAVTSSPEASPVKQIARSTVTQVLSRFTTAQQSATAKLATSNNSPFGTDYRSLAAPLSPIIGRAAGMVPQGIKSPTIPRAERGNPPPIPPKKPGLAQAPSSPAAVPRSPSHFSDSPLAGSCGLTSSQEGVKELDMVVSSN